MIFTGKAFMKSAQNFDSRLKIIQREMRFWDDLKSVVVNC